MKILLINQYFYPDVAATAQFLTELAEDLIELGAEVHVLRGTAPYDMVTNKRVPRKESFEKVTIHKTPALNLNGSNTLTHLLNYSVFNFTASFRTLTLPKFDAVVAFTTLPLIGLTGVAAKAVRKARFIQVIADLYPDVAIQLGYLGENSRATKLADKAARFMLNQADSIIVLEQAMVERVRSKGISNSDKISLIRNWADKDQVYPIPSSENWFLKEQGLEDKFVVQYSGHMGEGHDFTAVLKAAEALKCYDDIIFLFIGGGPKKGDLEKAKKKFNLNNLKFLPYQDKGDLAYTLSAADISLVTLKEGMEGLIVPSKIYGILASGRPVIFLGSSHSEIARIIENGECGFAFPPDDGDALEEKILELYSNRDRCKAMSKRARDYFLKNFDRSKMTKKFHDHLVDVVNS